MGEKKGTGTFKLISPKAKSYAAQNGIDYYTINGTGRSGAVLFRDVVGASPIASRPANTEPQKQKASQLAMRAAGYYGISLESQFNPGYRVLKDDVLRLAPQNELNQRSAFGKRLLAANLHMVPFTSHGRLNAGKMLEALEEIRANAAGKARPTLTDMCLLAAARALEAVPRLNSIDKDGEMVLIVPINMAIAIQSKKNGLLAPAIKDIAQMGISQIAYERTRLMAAAESKRLSNDDLENASFTLSNMGAGPVEYFTPVLNFPLNAILGIGGVKVEPAVVNGEIKPASFLYASLTLNHIHLNGQDASEFLAAFEQALQIDDWPQ
ncbi:MAG: 2-oxo acid dehydrogenase subunit E2 [Eubacteriaceae bacterium]|nr:2-oxo acid dehydrogenase subunit E2 [Eubacteriaceae bacterium]